MSKYGSFDIKGIHELEKAIKEKYEGEAGKRLFRKAVGGGADVMVEELKANYQKVRDKGYSKGYTADEIMHSNARSNQGIVTAKVGWNGDHDRWRLVHLEEWGYVKSGKQYTPPQFGLIDKTIEGTKSEYFEEVGKVLKSYL